MPLKPTDLVLAAVLKDKRDLEIARVLGWYRIPLKSAPKTVAVDYLALYQTAKFGEDKWAINYIAPVRGHELTTRAQLLRTQPNHPRAGEQYYKIQIGPLERLEHPVPSRAWRRITFLYTTGEHLLRADELNDLIVQSAERDRLWKALRERGLQPERQYEREQSGAIDLAVLCALGKLGIVLNEPEEPLRAVRNAGDWHYLTIPSAAVTADMREVIQTIEQQIEKLGGPLTTR
jgi:hypothetical protein